MTAKTDIPAAGPVLSFRVPLEINARVESVKPLFWNPDGTPGSRSTVGRSILSTVLEGDLTERLMALARKRDEPFAVTLSAVLQAGLPAVDGQSRGRIMATQAKS